MAVAFADEFGSVPKSPNFSASLGRAQLYAEEQGHRRITPEHLLLALTEDPDAAGILRALRVDIDVVRNDVAGLVGRLDDRFPLDVAGRPQISEDLQRVLDAAAAAAGSKRRVLDGALVLAALIGDGRSPAAEILRQQGVTFEAVVRSLRDQRPKTAGKPAASPPPGAAPAAEASEEEPVELVPRSRTERPTSPGTVTGGPADNTTRPSPPAASASPRPMPWQRDEGAASETPRPVEDDYLDYASDESVPYGMPRQAPMSPPQPYGGGRMPYPGAGAPRRRRGPPEAQARRAPAPATSPPAQGGQRRRSAKPGRRPGKSVERGILVENIPRVMRQAVSEIVEARIGRRDVEALNEGLEGSGTPLSHEIFVTRAMTVRLRAPDGGFIIESMSPETQWIENSLGIMEDDFASWRWSVLPQRRGRMRLQLVVSARSIGADGVSAETALPEQVIEVKVRTNMARALGRTGLWLGAAALTGIIGAFGEHSLRLVSRLIGQ